MEEKEAIGEEKGEMGRGETKEHEGIKAEK